MHPHGLEDAVSGLALRKMLELQQNFGNTTLVDQTLEGASRPYPSSFFDAQG